MRPNQDLLRPGAKWRKKNNNASGLERHKRAFYFGRFLLLSSRALRCQVLLSLLPPLTARVGAEKEKQRVGRMHCNDFQSFTRAGIPPPLPPLSLIIFDECQKC